MEAKKYLPLNTAPGEFMRPPTEPLDKRIIGVCLDLEKKINKELKGFGGRIFHPRLRIGSEVELNLFSDTFDPGKHTKDIVDNNPNYTKKHTRRVKRLLTNLLLRSFLNNRLWAMDPVTIGKEYRIFTELRTSTGDVNNYVKSMRWIRKYFQKRTPKRHINPVVHSEHIHMSFTSKFRGINVVKNPDSRFAIQMGIVDAYRRMFALVRLPEEIAAKYSWGDYIKILHGYDVRENGEDEGKIMPRMNPPRIEGRINNSEYAFDPYLNLLVQLVGVYRGLKYVSDRTKINSDYHHGNNAADYNRLNGSFGTNIYANHFDAAYAFLDDPVVTDLLGKELVNDIFDTIVSYSRLSEGRQGVAEVRSDRQKKMNDKNPPRKARFRFS